MHTILVVDDDESYRGMIEDWLCRKGCRVMAAANGAEALAAARHSPPDLVLSDILMPTLDGFALCRKWHQDPDLCAIPFVFCSATYTDAKDEALGLGLGARRFIHKSSDLQTIWDVLRQVLQGASSSEAGECLSSGADEPQNLKHYNQCLINKLEAKMVQLQETQKALQDEIERRKQLEKALGDSEKQFRAFVENSVDGILVADAESLRFVYANPAICSLLGYTKQEMSKMTVVHIHPENDLGFIQKEFEDLAKGIKSLSRAIPCRRKNGEIIYADIAAKPFALEGRNFVLGFFRDITDRLKVEEERQRLAEVVEHSPNIVMITDIHRCIQYVNPAFERITGFSAQEVLGHTPGMLIDGLHDPSYFKQIWNTVRRGHPWSGHLANKNRGGHLYHVEANIIPVQGQGGQIKNFVAVMRDVTHEEEMAARLRQAQKMEAIGTLAGGIAHDFNNILAAMLGFSELGMMTSDKGSRTREHFTAIYNAGERAKDLVAQILSFSRFNEESLKPIYLHTILKEALKLLRSTLPTTIAFQTDICKENIYIMADATAIHQIVMNLCTNAAHAMEGHGGTLAVALEQVVLTAKETVVHAHIKPGPHLKLSIRDTGHGMTRDILDHIFEPYFTTKRKGEGTGLGLSVVHGIVQSHGGMITVSSEPGQGSTFDVYFPVIALKSKVAETRHKTAARGCERILFVDDEIVLVRLVNQMLTRLGYRVTPFTDSRQALVDFTDHPQKYDMVISDFTMPHITGEGLARSILAVRPDIPFILCTGYSSKIDKLRIEKMGIKALLTKPFSLATIAGQIRAILDAQQKRGTALRACGGV